jgi:NAD(P)-dependent dehydrogenase (short-subunit alcohol dehydrogenase family)
MATPIGDTTGKHVLITGGNSGIGRETAAELARLGATVTITSRDAARGQEAAAEILNRTGSTVDVIGLDLASLASVRSAATAYLGRFDRLDILINNAGGILSRRSVTPDGFEATFCANYLGHFLLTSLLIERLKATAPARIVMVASDAHRVGGNLDFSDLQLTGRYGAWRAYGRSKLAMILFTRELARRLEGTEVTANSLHPGTIASGFGQDGDVSGLLGLYVRLTRPLRPLLTGPAEGARTTLFLATSPEVASVSGEYFVKSKVVTPSRAARDDTAARRLWEVSEALVVASDHSAEVSDPKI